MKKLNGWVVGGALVITLGVLYTICAVAFALVPLATLEFFNAWFHGLSLAETQSGAKPFTLGLFVYGLAGLAVGLAMFETAGFVLGAIHGNASHYWSKPLKGSAS